MNELLQRAEGLKATVERIRKHEAHLPIDFKLCDVIDDVIELVGEIAHEIRQPVRPVSPAGDKFKIGDRVFWKCAPNDETVIVDTPGNGFVVTEDVGDLVEEDKLEHIPTKAKPLQGKKHKRKNRERSATKLNARLRLEDEKIEVVCHDRTDTHLMIYRGKYRFDFWPSTGRWGKSDSHSRGPTKTNTSGLNSLIAEVLKIPSLLPDQENDGKGNLSYRYKDGCGIWLCPGFSGWKAHWRDRVPLRGEGRDGTEVDWSFETAEQAAFALWEGGEGPFKYV